MKPEDNQYSYKLENYDTKWSTPSKGRSAFYTNLSPGTYTFKVKASNADGIWNEEGASIEVVIASPWWLTWWAYLIYMSLLLFLIFYSFILYNTIAQQDNGKVISAKYNVSVSDVVIISSDSTFRTISNDQGGFYIPKSGSYKFSKEGYFSKAVSLDATKFNVVELFTSIENLTEIIISSNNFQQNLKKLPTAISVIDSKLLENPQSRRKSRCANEIERYDGLANLQFQSLEGHRSTKTTSAKRTNLHFGPAQPWPTEGPIGFGLSRPTSAIQALA